MLSENVAGINNNSANFSITAKDKAKLSLCLIKLHTIKTYRGVEVQLHVFLTSALVGVEWSVSHTPAASPPRKNPLVPIR
jgi:hypothetical protein